LSTLDLPKKEKPPHFKQNVKNRVREKGGAEAVQKAREKRSRRRENCFPLCIPCPVWLVGEYEWLKKISSTNGKTQKKKIRKKSKIF